MSGSHLPPQAGSGRGVFTETSLNTLKQLIAEGRVGNRWYKVNLHVHGERNGPQKVVDEARRAEIDLLAITDHQTFNYCDAIIAASRMQGRALKVLRALRLPHMKVCMSSLFSLKAFADDAEPNSWVSSKSPALGRPRSHQNETPTRYSTKCMTGGIIVIPHPKTQGIGLLDSARKISTKEDWLESGHIRLMQIHEEV